MKIPLIYMAMSLFIGSAAVDAPHTEHCAPCKMYIPNAFSPNGDARNDAFSVYPGLDCTFRSFSIKIFDRWGGLVYESESPDFAWDGRRNNEEVPAAVYIYAISYQIDSATTATPEQVIGDVALIRP